MNKPKGKPNLTYDESDLIEEEVLYRIEEAKENKEDLTEEEIRERVYNSDCLTYAWDDFQECLNEDLTEIDKSKFNTWKAKGFNMGWRNLEGVKTFKANNSKEFLKEILPNTNEFTLRIWKTKTELKIKCSHHDSPMGEWYIIKPLSKKEFKQFEKEQY